MNIFYFTDMFPKLSEIFISREIAGMERLGNTISVFSNLDPQDTVCHAINRHLNARVYYSSRHHPGKLVKGMHLLKYFFSRPRRYLKTLRCSKVQGLPEMKGLFRQLPLICDLVRMSGATHIHCHHGRMGMLTGWLVSRMLGLPFSVTLHGLDIQYSPYPSLGIVLNDADLVVCVSGKIREIAQASYRIPAAKTVMIRCGIPIEEYLFSRQPITGNKILAVARLDKIKGLNNLIKACAIIRDRNVTIECTIVGEGEERPMLEKEIQELKLSSVVRLYGALPNENLPNIYATHAVFVLPSYSEGLGVVVMEAMACGLPVVASNVGGLPEIISDGENGFLVEPGKPDKLAEAILRIITLDSVRLERIRSENRNKVELHFNSDIEINKLHKAFVGLAGHK